MDKHVKNGLRILLYFTAALVLLEGARLAAGWGSLAQGTAMDRGQAQWRGALLFVAVAAAVNLVFYMVVEQGKARAFLHPMKFLKCSLIGVITGVFWVGVVFALLLVLNLFHLIDVEPIYYAAGMAPALALGLGAADAASEELFFRGFAYHLLKKEYSGNVAAAVTLAVSLVGALKDVAAMAGVLAFVNYFLARVVFTLVRKNWNSLWAAIVAHFSWNCFLALVAMKGTGKAFLVGKAVADGGLVRVDISQGLVVTGANVVLILALAGWFLWRKSILARPEKK